MTKLEILDLRHYSARELRPLLLQAAEAWNGCLHWDYRSATELLLGYLDSRILPGFVAVVDGQLCGFCFCVYEGRKAVIGELFVSKMDDPTRSEMIGLLSQHLLETLQASPDLNRIEAQLLMFEAGLLPSLFTRFLDTGTTLRTFPRLFLELSLESNPVQAVSSSPIPTLPATITLSPWSPAFYHPAAELIQAAYTGHVDSAINDQYRTLEGSERFLHNIIRFPGCGTFDPTASWVLRDRRSHTLAAVLLCSRIAPGVAHLTQLCVSPNLRGLGLGHALLHHAQRSLPALGYRSLSLTVTEANTSAMRLYRQAGFTSRHRFDALVLEKANTRL